MAIELIDLQLINEAKNGNKHAFDALIIKYQYKIYKLLARYIHDSNEALDIAQETFIRAYNAIHRFRGDCNFYTWLYRIAINTAKNYLISKGRKVPEIDFEIYELERSLSKITPKDNLNPEKLLVKGEIHDIIYDILESLPKELKTALLLREIEGMTYDEIANIMECPVGTIRSRIYRAKEIVEKKADPFIFNR